MQHFLITLDDGEPRDSPLSDTLASVDGVKNAIQYVVWVSKNMPGMSYPNKALVLSDASYRAQRKGITGQYKEDMMKADLSQEVNLIVYAYS